MLTSAAGFPSLSSTVTVLLSPSVCMPGNDGIIGRQCKLAVGLCGRVARAVDRRIADGHRLIGEEIDLRVKIRRDAERDGAQLCPCRLLAALRLQMQGGLAEAVSS